MTGDKVYSAHGISMTLKQWAVHLSVEYKTLWARVNKGIELESALVKKMAAKKKERSPEKTLIKACLYCSHEFVIPKCRDWREHCCSSECKALLADRKKAASIEQRTRTCLTCSKEFIARGTQIRSGEGNYCTVRCHFEKFGMSALHRPEVQRLAAERLKALRGAGMVKYRIGVNNPVWKGGKNESRKRLLEKHMRNPEESRGKARAYRRKNHAKVKEWRNRRRDRKFGRLPKFTVVNMYKSQRGLCPVCKKKLGEKYHLDHIVPLARGGKHEPKNVQLLCPPCNLSKSAKDPIDFMQERGFLL